MTTKTRDESVPPPGWVEYMDDAYVYAWALMAADYSEGWNGVTLSEAWTIYDHEHGYAPSTTVDVRALRELAKRLRQWSASGVPITAWSDAIEAAIASTDEDTER